MTHEVLWDTWGVPHVFASSSAALAYGFGWAQMHCHGDLLVRLYGQARGRAAEYWGEEFVESDRLVLTMAVPERARRWDQLQTGEARGILDGFVAGLNAYARAHRDRLDAAVDLLLPLTPTDVLSHVQRTIHLGFVGAQALGSAQQWSAGAGSNAWAVAPARSATGHALLLADPHLPWSGQFTWFEAHLVGPDLDVYGATLVGLPLLGIAFNDYLGWTHTNNVFDGADLYELRLSGDGYLLDGDVRPFATRTETLEVRQPDGGMRRESLVVHSSVHGPILARQGDRAVAIRLAGLDQPHLIDQYWQMARATSLAAFESALARLQIPFFNVLYADRNGHILYLFGGRTPRRPHGDWDYWSGTVPGETTANLWTATHSYEQLPRVVDPGTGFLQNANDPPWTCTCPAVLDAASFPAYMSARGMGLRPQRSTRMLLDNAAMALDDLERAIWSTPVELAERVLDELLAAAEAHGSPRARQAAQVLSEWDRCADVDSRGAVLLAAWARQMGLERFTPGSRATVFARAWDPAQPLSTPAGLADRAAAIAALDAAACQVQQTYGRLEVAWGQVHRIRYAGQDLPAFGATDPLGVFCAASFGPPGTDGCHALTGGQSYLALVEFASPVRARVLLPYGNATQPDSPHRGDQMALYTRRQFRPVWRTREQILEHLERREVLP